MLEFFALDAQPCIKAVDALQRVARRFPRRHSSRPSPPVASKAATLRLVHSHHWTIPVAYDSTAAVAQLYDVDDLPDDRGRRARRHRQAAADRRALGAGARAALAMLRATLLVLLSMSN